MPIENRTDRDWQSQYRPSAWAAGLDLFLRRHWAWIGNAYDLGFGGASTEAV